VLRVLDVPEAFGLLAPTPLTLAGAKSPTFERTELIYQAAGRGRSASLPIGPNKSHRTYGTYGTNRPGSGAKKTPRPWLSPRGYLCSIATANAECDMFSRFVKTEVNQNP